MNRTARLYALVEELRAAAPRPLTVAVLAARFEVSTRTVQRDLQALMQTGVPVRTTPGRGGGWSIDPAMTLPPMHFTADEAAALAVALATTGASTPYAGAARTAAQKIAASMTGPASAAARELAARIVTLPSPTDSAVRAAVEQALSSHTVLRLSYIDAAGGESERVVEPAGLLTADGRWYLIAWCRMRQAGRGFRLDRITAAASTTERAQPYDLAELLRGSAAADAVPPSTVAPLTPPPPPAGRHRAGAPFRSRH
ncbi:proteasome accessory factor B [Streptomyces sp. Ag82_O1-12]|uniref:helix-turn-helix transcriptional regulator n=1 Tax=unclassified Streptomyces TaxID=2593676 RepID=UPI000BDD970E|nr:MULTISPECIES: YafY family protein [unclassified Streptomyces]SMQ18091.1 proteasome accessory factor B [Streptomyces sp. Ag82_O1-12]SOD47128.1 proteasome accessory factor B [Streptomyces sp. Ag82_G6-1]